MNSLVDHARRELELAGVEHEVRPSLIAAVAAFASYSGHSGTSAAICTDILTRLLRYQNLAPIGVTTEEWVKISEGVGVTDDAWQNARRFSTFSRDGGITWYDIDDPRACNGDTWGFGCPLDASGVLKATYQHDWAVDEDGIAVLGSTCLDCGEVNL